MKPSSRVIENEVCEVQPTFYSFSLLVKYAEMSEVMMTFEAGTKSCKHAAIALKRKAFYPHFMQ